MKHKALESTHKKTKKKLARADGFTNRNVLETYTHTGYTPLTT
jgi:putative alpha-1,2-mannosidase